MTINRQWWVDALIVATLVTLIFGAGWVANGWRKDAEISRLKTAWSDQSRRAAEKNTAELADAITRGDDLTTQLNAWQLTLTTFAEEKNREIDRLSTGRRCLDGALVRVLNTGPGQQLRGDVSTATGGAVRPDGSAGADTDDRWYSTDRDIAVWINRCQSGYDTCRARLDKLNDYYKGRPQHDH